MHEYNAKQVVRCKINIFTNCISDPFCRFYVANVRLIAIPFDGVHFVGSGNDTNEIDKNKL